MPKRARCPHCDRLFNRDRLDDHVIVCRQRTQTDGMRKRNGRKELVVDGNNVAYYLSANHMPKASNLTVAIENLLKKGYRPLTIVSAALIHKIDSPDSLRALIGSGKVREARRGQNDDLLIIKLAEKMGADIMSNDRFLNWRDRFPWLERRLRRYRMTPSGLILL